MNILRSLQAGQIPGNRNEQNENDDIFNEEETDLNNHKDINVTGVSVNLSLMRTEYQLPSIPKPKNKLVRTISSMDENVLNELTKSDDLDKRIILPTSIGQNSDVSEMLKVFDDDFNDDMMLPPNKIALSRRNTGSTMYVGTTMSAPDKDATIKCVCGVFRAHMVQSLRDTKSGMARIPFEEYDVFDDNYKAPTLNQRTKESFNNIENSTLYALAGLNIDCNEAHLLPSLNEITQFYRDIFRKSQMESDCIIMSLIYVERLMKETNGGVRPSLKNWKSVMFASMIMSSKVWDDLSMWNSDFSKICHSFTLQRVNQLEMAMLSALKYIVKVPASEYAKYYFLLRSMLIKSGLGSDELKTLNPLDITGAKKLEYYSGNYEESLPNKVHTQRSKSCSEFEASPGEYTESGSSPKQGGAALVSLEQVVRMGTKL